MIKHLFLVPALLLALAAAAGAEDTPPAAAGGGSAATTTAPPATTATTDQGDPAKKTDIVADQMEILDAEKQAIFKGKVDLKRGDVHWTADSMVISYEEIQQPDGSTRTEVKTVDSTGDTKIVTKTQTITGEWAKMDVKANKLKVGGNVKVVTGKSILTGELLNTDLNTNKSEFSGGRVKGSFLPD